jgi:hypothetical protein
MLQQLHTPYGIDTFNAVGGFPYLLIDLNNAAQLTAIEQATIAEKLPEIPCPILSVNTQDAQAIPASIMAAIDLVTESEKELQPILQNIQKFPMTAAMLVQVSRHNARTSVADGLLTESLAFAALQGGKEFQHWLLQRPKVLPEQTAQPNEPAVEMERCGNQLTIWLNRPHKRNAYSVEMRDSLFEALQLVCSDSTIDNVCIKGRGDCFCVGGDLDEFGIATDTTLAHLIRSSRHVGKLLYSVSDRVQVVVHRACIGSGIELPAFASRVIASEDTYFQLPEITMGLIPGAGGTVSILRRIGRQRFNYFALSAKRINAKTALAWGLIDEVR